MSDTSFNPYATPETDCLATAKEPLPPSRSGLLLAVTLVQVTVEAMCFVVLCSGLVLLSLSTIAGRLPFQSLAEFVAVMPICLMTIFLFMLLRAECRNFRPARDKERNIQLATLSLALLPIAVGCWMLSDGHWRLSWKRSDVARIWFGIAGVWILLAGLRWYLHERATASATHAKSQRTPYSAE